MAKIYQEYGELESESEDLAFQHEKWYFGKIGRAGAEECLGNHLTLGTFLVRDSDTTPGTYSLSVVKLLGNDGFHISHHKILCLPNSCFWIHPGRRFKSMEALIGYYQSNMADSNFALTRPCPKGAESPQDSDSYDEEAEAEEMSSAEGDEYESDVEMEPGGSSTQQETVLSPMVMHERDLSSPTFYAINDVKSGPDEAEEEDESTSSMNAANPPEELEGEREDDDQREEMQRERVTQIEQTYVNWELKSSNDRASPPQNSPEPDQSDVTESKDDVTESKDDDTPAGSVDRQESQESRGAEETVEKSDDGYVRSDELSDSEREENRTATTIGAVDEGATVDGESETPDAERGPILTPPIRPPADPPSPTTPRATRPPPTIPSRESLNMQLTSEKYKAELDKQAWYFGKIGRPKAVELLERHALPGMFMVRDSDSNTHYSLSVYVEENNQGQVKHYKVEVANNLCFIGNSIKFFNISALISFYKAHQLAHKNKLTRPCPKQDGESPVQDAGCIDPDKIALTKQIAAEKNYEIWQGLWDEGIDVRVTVVNQVKNALAQPWKRHTDMLERLQHESIINFYGLSNIASQDKTYVVTEWFEKGSLLECLKGNHLAGQMEKIYFAEQVSNAMLYLHAKGIVLRNLQAKHILVSNNSLPKISNFSTAEVLTDGEFTATEDTAQIPIKWTSPDAAIFRKFSPKSDVWSFGVLLFEMFSDGQEPYADMAPLECLFRVKEGYRLPPSALKNCSKAIHDLMLDCWEADPAGRPSFGRVRAKLRALYSTVNIEVMVLRPGMEDFV